jgi:branched-subunit amino acid transport protein
MTDLEYLVLLLGMGAVTYIPRWMPLAALTRRRLPAVWRTWLDLIPPAILSALLVPSLVAVGNPRQFSLGTPELIVALPTFVFAMVTRSLGGTVFVGMLLYWGLGKWL